MVYQRHADVQRLQEPRKRRLLLRTTTGDVLLGNMCVPSVQAIGSHHHYVDYTINVYGMQ